MSDARDRDALLHRVELLEQENARLRQKLEPLLGPDNPNFQPHVFMKVLQRTILLAMIPVWLGVAAMLVIGTRPGIKMTRVADIPLFSFGNNGGKATGIGAGIISFGGLSVGAISFGGFSVGLLAFGGCAVGLVAVGGGAFGVIAIGGGAVGVVAVGGGATGYFALGQKAHGRYALGMNRQDQEAIDFFRPYIPGLRRALTNPMPVILLKEQPQLPGTRTSADSPTA